MIFKRRDRRPIATIVKEFFFPRGGWWRAATYVVHRVRRLPDPPHRVGRGVAAGVFISFTPLFGFHFLGAAGIAWLLRGNILAALLATFFGNPFTTPIIAVTSVRLGQWFLGLQDEMTLSAILGAFAHTSEEIWHNVLAIFTSDPTRWGELVHFFKVIFLPYLLGGILPGLFFAVLCHYLTLPLISAYQRLRQKKTRERSERLRAAAAARLREKAD